MKHNTLLIISIVFFLFGCKDEEPGIREFPIIKTLDAIDINSSGVTFQGELIKKGTIPTTTSYGFVWDTKDPTIDHSYKIIVGEDINSSNIKVKIDSTLVNGLEYYVRTFATYNNKTVYGNVIKFISKGSTKGAWSLEMTGINMPGWSLCYGSSNNESGCIIFQSSEVYSFNPEKNKISSYGNFPRSGNTGTRFISVAIENTQYFFNDIDRYLYKLQAGSWTKQSNVPFRYDFIYYHGFAVSDSIFILSSSQSYMYNLKTNLWQKKATLPLSDWDWSVGGTDLKNKAYVITTDRSIWEYNTVSDSWIKKTKYPGLLYEEIVSFSFNDKLYFGLSHHDHSTSKKWFDRKLWIYDPVLNSWSSAQEFPNELSESILFFFCIKGKLYFGDGGSGIYRIWKFNPSILDVSSH